MLLQLLGLPPQPVAFALEPAPLTLHLAAVALGSREVVTQSRDLRLRAVDPLISLIATLATT